MVIIINKSTTQKEIDELLKMFHRSNKKNLVSFYGKLKGAFGDGLEYQKKVRR
jgi:hypothetical protein